MSEPIYPLLVAWFTHDPLKGIILAACLCIVLWHLLLDDGSLALGADEAD